MTKKTETLIETTENTFEIPSFEFSVDDMNLIMEKRGLNWVKLKVVEELNELATAIVQTMTKPDRIKPEEVTDELGDVILHLPLVLGLYNPQIVQKRMAKKKEQIMKQYRTVEENQVSSAPENV